MNFVPFCYLFYLMLYLCYFPIEINALADLRGGAPGARPPYGSRFFRFDMQNFWNVATSGVHSPPYEVHAPPYGKSWIRHCNVLQSDIRIVSPSVNLLCKISFIAWFKTFERSFSQSYNSFVICILNLHWKWSKKIGLISVTWAKFAWIENL